MKRYIHNPAVFGTPGKRMAHALQDVGIPILDILVRESIQNSLDAADKASDSPYVMVEYKVDDFSVRDFTKNFEGLSSLNTRTDLPSRVLSIRDRHTVGLSGDFNDEKSNLKKLVSGFMNNQENEGAGGSWGIGKTIYYRLGVGLVLYYSRVRKSYNQYESLLCAVLVEDPDSPKAIIPNVDGSNKFGIAMWGEPIPGHHDGVVQETRDADTINNILESLHIVPFGEKETGTAIIIPFVNEEDLLANNRSVDDEGETPEEKPYWLSDIEDYLSIAVQRWYAARLNNADYCNLYHGGKALLVSINDNLLDSSRERNFCKILRTIYTKAALTIAGKERANEITFNGHPIEVAQIELNNIDGKDVGQFAYIRIPVTELDCEHISLYTYVDQKVPKGTPVVVYSRKPGMIVSYETVKSAWVPEERSPEDEYLIGYFVLKSSAKLKKAQMDIEAYIRDGEQATHNSWDDKQIDIKYNPQQANYKPPFVKKISEKIAKIISDAIVPNRSKIEDKTRDVTFGNLFGKIFLKNVLAKKGGRANEGMEKGGNSPTVSPSLRSRRNTTASDSVSYSPDGKVIITVHLSASKNKPSKGCKVELQVLSATGAMSASEWYNQVGTLLPFNIESITPTLKSLDGHKCSDSKLLNIDNLYSRNSEVYGFTLSFKDDEEHSYISDIELELNIRMRESKPSIYVSDLE